MLPVHLKFCNLRLGLQEPKVRFVQVGEYISGGQHHHDHWHDHGALPVTVTAVLPVAQHSLAAALTLSTEAAQLEIAPLAMAGHLMPLRHMCKPELNFRVESPSHARAGGADGLPVSPEGAT